VTSTAGRIPRRSLHGTPLAMPAAKLVLDSVARGRKEAKRLAYLAHQAPGA
jgi:hypothetical protein